MASFPVSMRLSRETKGTCYGSPETSIGDTHGAHTPELQKKP